MNHRHTALDQLRNAHKLSRTNYEEMVICLSEAWVHACLDIAQAIRDAGDRAAERSHG